MQNHRGTALTLKQTISTMEFLCEKTYGMLAIYLWQQQGKIKHEQALFIYLQTVKTLGETKKSKHDSEFMSHHPALSVSLSLITDGERESLLGQMHTQNGHGEQ